ncbi:hypothetical protein GUJ93_ZPchr0003g17292 [Zizania palustris]|uniref:Uncharacterized protein n=1 Tax=Zizania palustris TaxID=103762 RepID=A0A8J5STI0_ZIZPA|nr:hypothetical protein GUJ93_ZPchr0003g17292 [Zizania palustris]
MCSIGSHIIGKSRIVGPDGNESYHQHVEGDHKNIKGSTTSRKLQKFFYKIDQHDVGRHEAQMAHGQVPPSVVQGRFEGILYTELLEHNY